MGRGPRKSLGSRRGCRDDVGDETVHPHDHQSKQKGSCLGNVDPFRNRHIALSLWMYLESKEHNWVANIGNVFDPIMCWAAVLVLVYCSRQRWGRVVFDFDSVHLACFVLAGIIIVYWALTSSAFLANLALQTVIVVGYVPTWRKLWLAPHNTEPVKVWLIFLFGSLVSLIPAWAGDNTLAKVYAVRATICTLILFFFMIRAELREPEEK